MKNPHPRRQPGGGFPNSDTSNSRRIVSDQRDGAQSPPDIPIGACWKSPRDKSACIQATIKSYNDSRYLDLRIYEAGHDGRMLPTSKGVTVSMARLPALAKLVGDGYRRAAQLGLLTTVSSS